MQHNEILLLKQEIEVMRKTHARQCVVVRELTRDVEALGAMTGVGETPLMESHSNTTMSRDTSELSEDEDAEHERERWRRECADADLVEDVRRLSLVDELEEVPL